MKSRNLQLADLIYECQQNTSALESVAFYLDVLSNTDDSNDDRGLSALLQILAKDQANNLAQIEKVIAQ